MGAGSSNHETTSDVTYELSESGTKFTFERITTEAIFVVTRNHDLDEDVENLLKEAAIHIHDFDKYRDNMLIRAYGEEKEEEGGGTITILAGDGKNVLEVQPDGEGNIQCTWTSYSAEAKFFKVLLPKLGNFAKENIPKLVGAVL